MASARAACPRALPGKHTLTAPYDGVEIAVQVGIVCPVDRERVSNDACRACSRSRLPRPGRFCQYSPEMIYGMTDGGVRRATAHYSATMCTGCLRQTQLMTEVDYHVDLDRAFPAFRGQWGHLVTEHNPVPGTIYEVRWQLPFQLGDGRRVVIFTGQGDALDLVLRCYRDFKTKTQS